MNKRELAHQVAVRSGITKTEAGRAVQAMIDCIMETLQSGERITLMGFGAFFPHERPPREAYSPYSGKCIQLDTRKTVKFKPTFPVDNSKNDRIKGPSDKGLDD